MSRKPIRPARKAATATSLAALSTAGAAPPARKARRASAERREALAGRAPRSRAADRGEVQPRRGPAHAARASPRRRRSACACRAGPAGPASSRRVNSTRLCTIDCGWTRTSIRVLGRCRTGSAPRSSRGPCSSWWRDRPRSWRPSTSWGGATACSGVAARHLVERRGAERPAGGGEDQPLDARARPRRAAPGRWRSARNRPAAARRRCSRPRACSSAPAQTRLSLLASATIAPRRTAASAGARPAAPTMAAITQSAARAAASTRPLGAGRDLDAACRPAPRLQRRDRPLVGDHRERGASDGPRAGGEHGRRCGRRSAPRPR